jgi:uncharacterized protein with von Willebrand factor type A (vWA) domain
MVTEKTEKFRLSEKGLIANIARFSHLLRDHGIAVSLPSVLDALRSLPFIDIFNLPAFHALLRANLICRQEDMAEFERLFYAFWLPKHRPGQRIPPEQSGQENEKPEAVFSHRIELSAQRLFGGDKPKVAQDRSLRYSPDSPSNAGKAGELGLAESRVLYAAVFRLLQALNKRVSRRLQYTLRGKTISLRRILRKNIQFGGELILLDFKKKKLKNRRVVFFGDVSGSMDIHTEMILQFIHALKRIDRRTEIFFFSTDLCRATHQFVGKDFNSAIAGLPEQIAAWGGGTRIGHCLRIFKEIHGRKLLSKKSIVMIFSDGWDRGEIDVLEAQMAWLKRKSYKIIWLNPLSGTKDYQPICRGMRAALPYVDYFLPMSGLQDLRLLGQTLSKAMI